MILTTIEELRRVYPAHAIDNIEAFTGYIDNSEHDFLLQPLGQPLYERLQEYYDQNRHQLSSVDDAQTGYYNKLLILCQRCVAFDAIGRSLDQQAVSINNSGLNMSVADDYKAADRDAKNDAKSSCAREAHAALNRLLYTLETWTMQVPAPEDVTEETEELFEIVKFWRCSRYFYLAAQLLIPSSVVMQEYLNIYDSREKFIQLLPDLHFIQEEYIASAIGEEFLDFLLESQIKGGTKRDAAAASGADPVSLADDSDIDALVRRLLHLLRRIMVRYLEGRTTILKTPKERQIAAHDEAVRLLAGFRQYCQKRQQNIMDLSKEAAEAYSLSPMYIEPEEEKTADGGCCHRVATCISEFNDSDDAALLVTHPLL